MDGRWPGGAVRSGSDGSSTADSGYRVKCGLVWYLQTRISTVVIGVDAHFGVACWGTTARRMDSNGANREALRNCHRHTSLARTGSGLTEIQLAGGEPFGDQHDAGAGWTAEAGWLRRIDAFRHAEQSAQRSSAALRLRLAKSPKWRMRTRPPGRTCSRKRRRKLICGNGHDLLLAAVGIISPAEGDAIVLEGHEAMAGNGDAMRVARQVVENMFGAAEGWLGVDHPVLLAELPEVVAKWAR